MITESGTVFGGTGNIRRSFGLGETDERKTMGTGSDEA